MRITLGNVGGDKSKERKVEEILDGLNITEPITLCSPECECFSRPPVNKKGRFYNRPINEGRCSAGRGKGHEVTYDGSACLHPERG